MSDSYSKRTLLGLLVVALSSVAAVPFVLPAEDPTLVLRRQSIAAMTQAERQRLQRNFERFTAMDARQQEQVREFSAALEVDQTSNRGRLGQTLRVYEQWLQTLTPHQRDALRRQPDPLQRISLMRELVDDQRDVRIEVRMGERSEFLGPLPQISRSDLEAMLTVLDGKLGLYLDDPAELAGYEGMRRYLKMFELLARQRRTIRDLLGDANMQLLMAAISDEQTREQLQTLPEADRPLAEIPLRRLKMGLAIYQAIEVELDRELRSRRVSPENLARYFDELTLEEQDELLTLIPSQFQQQLLSRYVETEWSQNRINMRLVRQFFRPQRPPGDPSAPPRPPDGGGMGQRRPGEAPTGARLPGDRRGNAHPPDRP